MMNRKMRSSWCFLVMGILILGLTLGMTCKKRNQPPNAPSIPSGPVSGRKGDSLRFSTIAEDPDGDSVAVRFDWGDSTMSDWSKLVPSGDSVVMTYAWQRLATYSIRAQARDAKDTASVWSGEHQLMIASFSVTFGGTGDDEGNSVQQTSDGGYIIAGWTNSYSAGGYDLWLVKTDADGNKTWDKTLGVAFDDAAYSVQQTLDGGYIVVGSTFSYGAGIDVRLVKTDASGNKTWDRTFGGTGEDVGHSVRQTSDGGYIITGWTLPFNAETSDVWLIKTDELGNKVWDRTFGGSGWDRGHSVRQTSDGGYIITGYVSSSGPNGFDVWLIKTDASGNKVWDKSFGGTGSDVGYAVQQTTDGGYIITGWTATSFVEVWLIKTDASGNEVWDRTFAGLFDTEGYSVQQTSDGGYVISGRTWSYSTGNYDLWLIRTDSSGNEVWDRTFGGTGDDQGNSVQQTSDGGFIIAGSTESYGAGSSDVWLIKTDADGN